MARNARNLRILDEFYRIRAAGVLRNADVCIVYQMVLIEHNVLENRAKTERLEDVRFILGRQIDSLGVAAAFNIEDALLAPAMLIVANEIAYGGGRECLLTRAPQAEWQRRTAGLFVRRGRTVHRENPALRCKVIRSGEYALLHLA